MRRFMPLTSALPSIRGVARQYRSRAAATSASKTLEDPSSHATATRASLSGASSPSLPGRLSSGAARGRRGR